MPSLSRQSVSARTSAYAKLEEPRWAPLLRERMRVRFGGSRPVLVAISGGPDSVVLAHLMRSAGLPIILAHVDHQLRPNSAADSVFVSRLAKQWQLRFRQAKVNVRQAAKRHQQSIEEAARDKRYTALVRMARAAGCKIVVTAHNADDQVETVLMNFLRGAGPAGLAGIPGERFLAPSVTLERPMLDIDRIQVMAYLKAHHLRYRVDLTNRHLAFTRNRIRRRTLPYLEKLFPGLRKRLVQLDEILHDEESWWADVVDQAYQRSVRRKGQDRVIDLEVLFGYHKALGRRILRRMMGQVSFADITRVFELARTSNTSLTLPLAGPVRVRKQSNQLIFSRSKD